MKIILTRHGETIENKKGMSQGWLPGRLSSLGKKQAKLVAKRLKDVRIDVIYTSDLARAHDTAKEIAKFHKNTKLIIDKRIKERSLGVFSGKTREEYNWNSVPGTLLTKKPKNGESYKELHKRVKEFYRMLLKKYSDETILIVSHGGSMRALEGIILKKSPSESVKIERLKNAAISEYEIDKKGNSKIIRINCDLHLK
jgi:broad specificity phosphatase PhoE